MSIRKVSIIAAVAVALIGVGYVTPAHAEPTMSARVDLVGRISGSDRYGTSVAVAQAAFPTTAPVVYIASGAAFPDALAAGPAAVHQGGPLLLTAPNTLPSDVATEITSLAPSRIVIVGGTGAVSTGVETALKALAPTVTRVAGDNRYQTSLAVAEYAFTDPVSTVYMATGRTFPDALAAGAAAAKAGGPLLLVNGNAKTLDALTRTVISTTLTPKTIVVVGGPSVMSAGVLAAAKGLATTTTRVSGGNRYTTAAAIGTYAWPSATHAYMATGLNFPDGLVATIIAGVKGDPLFLTTLQCQDYPAYVGEFRLGVRQATLIGGPATVEDSAVGPDCPIA